METSETKIILLLLANKENHIVYSTQICIVLSESLVTPFPDLILFSRSDGGAGRDCAAWWGGLLCQLCEQFKELEDNWIMKLGCFYHPSGLNKRDEIKSKVRSKY